MTSRIAMTAALALSLAAVPVMAQDQGPGGAGQQRMGGPGRGGPGGPGGPMAILPGLDQVNLTDSQREQIRSIMEEQRASGPRPDGVREAEQALRTAVLNGDATALETAKTALATAQATALDHRVDLMVRVAQVLTATQRQQLAQLPAPQGRPRGRGGRGDGPPRS